MKQAYYIVLCTELGETFPHDSIFPARLMAEDFILDELCKRMSEYCDYSDKEMESYIERERESLQKEDYASLDIGRDLTIYAIHKLHIYDPNDRPLTSKEIDTIYKGILKKQKPTKNKVNGLYPKKFMAGFFDPYIDAAAHRVLSSMGLPDDILPFDAEQLLSKGSVSWKDGHNNIAEISFTIKDELLTCSASYLGKTASNEMDLNEYEDEKPASKAKSTSQDIGAGCVEALDEVFDYDTYPYPYLDDE